MFTAYDVSKTITNSSDFKFNIDQELLAKELRTFADKIVSGEYVLQKLEVNSIGMKDEFPMTHVHFELYERTIKT